MRKVIVIGAGPAGMMAASEAALRGHGVVLLEKNDKPGRKLYITGKGRCNVTNACESGALINGMARNGRFLYSALSAFDNHDAMAMLEKLGVPLVIERGGRVFPKSGKASDITAALVRRMEKAGVRLDTGREAAGIAAENGRVSAVLLKNGEKMHCDAAIVCTGGITYPSTGSTGDGYAWAERLGHRIETPRPALVPLETKETWPRRLQGLSLKNVGVSAEKAGKPLFSERGEMLFTHFGVSGPLILELSSVIADAPEGVRITIDLKPALELDTLDGRLIRELTAANKKLIRNSLDELFPSKLIPVFLELIAERGVSGEERAIDVTRTQRRSMAELIKRLELTVLRTRSKDEAIITRGGVSVRQISPSTMESRLVKGLYFAGEVIDVDGFTGGYNIQTALSTGFLAGSAC